MNYIKQLNGFFDSLLVNPLSTTAQTLYVHLLDINNRCGWKERFPVANIVLQSRAMLSRQQLDRARNELKQKGYIDYEKGTTRKAGTYLIVCFDTNSDTNSSTNSDTKSDTKSGQIACTYYKHKLKEKEKISTIVDIQKTAVIALPLNDGTEYGVEQSSVDKWTSLYPAVDVMQELRKMAGWLDANRTKRKTRRGIEKFINSWLAREQDRGGIRRGAVGTDTTTHGGSNAFKELKLGLCSDNFE